MSKPLIDFTTTVELAFMRIHESDDAEDSDRERDREVELEQMAGALPDDALDLVCLEYEVDHSPGLNWRIEDHFYLVPLKGEPYD